MNNFEVEPLGVTLSVHVILKQQVVLHIVDFDCPSQIAVLETRIKDQDVFLLRDVDCVGVLSHELLLWLKLGKMLEHELVEVIGKVSLPWLSVKQLLPP